MGKYQALPIEASDGPAQGQNMHWILHSKREARRRVEDEIEGEKAGDSCHAMV